MATTIPTLDPATLHRRWGLALAIGVVMVVLGTLGLGAAGLLTLASVVFFGWLLILRGVLQAAHAFGGTGHGRIWQLFGAALSMGLGVLFLANPVEGAVSLTLVLAVFFVAGGVIRIVTAFALPGGLRFWMILGGAVSIVLGAMVWNQFPASAVWLIGTFVAIDLIFDGWGLVMAALAARRVSA